VIGRPITGLKPTKPGWCAYPPRMCCSTACGLGLWRNPLGLGHHRHVTTPHPPHRSQHQGAKHADKSPALSNVSVSTRAGPAARDLHPLPGLARNPHRTRGRLMGSHDPDDKTRATAAGSGFWDREHAYAVSDSDKTPNR